MRSLDRLVLIGAIFMLGAGTAAGHHSPSRFDMGRVVTLEGTVARYDFTNPHVYIYLDVPGVNGQTITWELEASSTPNLSRRGWGPDSVKVGEHVSVRVNPPRMTGQLVARAQSVIWADGRSLAVRGDGSVPGPADADASSASLSGTWLGRYGLAQVGQNLASWPMTAKGREAQAAYDGTQNPQIDCIPVAAPSIMLYSNIYSVDVARDLITIDVEWMNVRREIWLDGRAHSDSTERTNQGHSVGHWEDDVLVVDTRNFSDNGAGNAFEIPSGASKHLTERIRLSDDGKRVEYSFVLEDPEYLSEPVRGEGIWDYRPDLVALPYQCDPEIARRFLSDRQ
jgi:hypothetical protein